MKNEKSDNPGTGEIKTLEDILRFLKSEASGFAVDEDKCQLKELIEILESYEAQNASCKNSEMSTEKS